MCTGVQFLRGPEEGGRSFRAGVTGSHMLPSVVLGTELRSPRESSKRPYRRAISPAPAAPVLRLCNRFFTEGPTMLTTSARSVGSCINGDKTLELKLQVSSSLRGGVRGQCLHMSPARSWASHSRLREADRSLPLWGQWGETHQREAPVCRASQFHRRDWQRMRKHSWAAFYFLGSCQGASLGRGRRTVLMVTDTRGPREIGIALQGKRHSNIQVQENRERREG